MSNCRGFWPILKIGAISNLTGFTGRLLKRSATGDEWSFSGGRSFKSGSRLCEGWLDVTRRAMQAGYWTNSRARRWRAFDFKVSSLRIMNPSYKATIAMFDSFVSNSM